MEALPMELGHKIIAYLDPPGLLTLSQTCKRFYDPISDREFWIRILKSECADHNIFLASFPEIATMSLRKLQRAAMGPYLWRNTVDKQAGNRNARLKIHKTVEFSDKGITAGVALVPGGKFLVSYTEGAICLYDLGPKDGSRIKLIDTIPSLPSDVDYMGGCVQSNFSSNRRLRLLLHHLDDSWVRVYEIDVLEPKPVFRQVGDSLTFIGGLDTDDFDDTGAPLALFEDCAVIQTCRSTIVWNFVERTYAAWIHHEDSNTRTVCLNGNTFVQVVQEAIYLWEIPLLQPYQNSVVDGCIEIDDESLPEASFEEIEVVGTLPDAPENFPSCWHSTWGIDDSICLSIVWGVPKSKGGDPRQVYISQYRLHLPVHVPVSDLLTPPSAQVERVSNRKVLPVSTHDVSLYFPKGIRWGRYSPNATERLEIDDGEDCILYRVSFCPFSGRLAGSWFSVSSKGRWIAHEQKISLTDIYRE